MLREGGRIGLRSGSFMDSGEVKESRRKSDFDASANRVAAATNIESMEQALGSGIGPKTKAVDTNTTVELLSQPLVMEEKEILKVQASDANELHVIASILEIEPREVTT